MPSLLGKLGADVLAVNPYVSTAGRLGHDQAAAAERVAGLVRSSGAHLGAIIDPDGERITFVDDTGRVLDDTLAMLCFVDLVCDHLLGDTIALPVNVTERAADLARAHGVRCRHDQDVDRRPDGCGGPSRRSASPPTAPVATSFPDSCRRSTAPARC